ncbi:dipicolinate synthase subunit B [Domibacillus sp. PGB-M46]|uniref:dipicolinate synthase subunit B n=1 Tax=Domibacillus sp. PGB-M46 TaxID=2910255 RepID=UPI001F57DC13|nr:dipicolinate synthase subunit B [Domibacillus sp. PGB-M46]MCI2255481.1 dipicolinate synthase subunit B [Domibacillus sp. PGB-M46]
MDLSLKGRRIGFGITGSHCTFEEIVPVVAKLKELGAEVVPVATNTVQKEASRFGSAGEWLKKVEEVAGQKAITTIQDAEPLGPKNPVDCMVIAPMTGNSISKFANAATDSPVLMAAKATLRNGSPVVLAVSTNDALGLNSQNIVKLLNMKNIYFVPFGQDDPIKKPNSLVAFMDLIPATVSQALSHKQIQPLLKEYPSSTV